MKFSEVIVLLAAGTLGGIFSTVVSIASLVTYPVLLALGVPPLSANMTNTVSLVLTGAGSVAGSGPELQGQGQRVLRLGIITALGGAVGDEDGDGSVGFVEVFAASEVSLEGPPLLVLGVGVLDADPFR